MREPSPVLYVLHQTFTLADGSTRTRRGIIAALELTDFDEGVVLPHERTHSGPKVDRLKLLQATAVTPQGMVTLFCTHLTHGDPAVNRDQFAALKAHVDQASDGPSIVAGDLNATEDVLQVGAAGWTDTYRAAQPGERGDTCCIQDLTLSDRTLSKRIDYLYLASGAEEIRIVDSRQILDQPVRLSEGLLWASDHVGVLTTLSLQE